MVIRYFSKNKINLICRLVCVLVTIFSILSCSNSNKKSQTSNSEIEVTWSAAKKETPVFSIDADSILNQWTAYYKLHVPHFSVSDFHYVNTDSLNLINGNVLATFDKEFNPIYHDFLVYNSAKNSYIDFDSYSLMVGEDGKASFTVDQEINLVSIPNRSVQRIAFRGALQWVEDAYWKNDSVIVLLEGTYEKRPLITEIHVKEQLIHHFEYKDTLDFETDYYKVRLLQKNMRVE